MPLLPPSAAAVTTASRAADVGMDRATPTTCPAADSRKDLVLVDLAASTASESDGVTKKPLPRKLLQKAAKKRRRSRSHGQEVGQ